MINYETKQKKDERMDMGDGEEKPLKNKMTS